MSFMVKLWGNFTADCTAEILVGLRSKFGGIYGGFYSNLYDGIYGIIKFPSDVDGHLLSRFSN